MRDEALYENLRQQDPPNRLIRKLQEAALVDEATLTCFALRQRSEAQPLADSEQRALSCIAAGMTTGMAAAVLGVSAHTVERQLKSARFHLRAKNTTHAVCLAIRGGLIA